MNRSTPLVLTLNGGSSSIRFSIYSIGPILEKKLAGKIERIGSRGTRLVVDADGKKPAQQLKVRSTNAREAGEFLLRWLETQPGFASIRAVGHRVVHGMDHSAPARVTPKLLTELRRITPYDPEHLPGELALIEAVRQRSPRLPQIACFDTAFHQSLPRVARLLPIPRRYARQGVRRYGFHGLSYSFLMTELARLDRSTAKGRVILAHLGNGASLAAVKEGKSFDTSMGFTPTAGLVMSTRTGDLDPGLAYYLARTEGTTPAQFHHLANHESGLLGISETSSDIRDLLAREKSDPRAADAIALFCYQTKKWIGAYTAALGGVDTIVFSGGIGEHAASIRSRICAGLEFLGLKLDRRANAKSAAVISLPTSRIRVRVIPTDEELVIARSVAGLMRWPTQ